MIRLKKTENCYKMMNKTYALVSVIVPCFRCISTIEYAVLSVFKQTLRPAELILVDDCSSDGTLDTLYQLQSLYQSGWIKVIALNKNSGPASARNRGWEQATQPYIAFLDADDSWHEQKIAIQYNWMCEHPQVVLTGHACLIKQAQCQNFTLDRQDFSVVTSRRLLLSNCFVTPSVMLKRNLPFRLMAGKRYSEDYLLWLQIGLAGLPCYWSAAPLVFLHKPAFGADGLSSQLWQMQMGEMDNFMQLYRQGLISGLVFSAVLSWSGIKFLRRLLIAFIRRLRV